VWDLATIRVVVDLIPSIFLTFSLTTLLILSMSGASILITMS
jgi:hypothetical protein